MAAAVLALAACETIQQIENPADKPYGGVSVGTPAVGGQSEADSIVFTASLGVQSKTYLDYNGYSYDLLWAENDQILIWDADSLYKDRPQAYEFCSIKDGIGSSSAKFLGTLQAENYVALYADSYQYPIDGCPAITLPVDQYLWLVYDEYNFGNGAYPMVAVSDGQNFAFQNLCSILKVSITGNGELLKYVTVSAANGEPMAGLAMVHGSGNDFSLEFVGETEEDGVYSWVDYECGVVLSEDPVDCYIVIPAQTYSGGFDITVLTDRGSMGVSSGQSVTTQRSKFYDVAIEFAAEEGPEESISYMLGDYTLNAESFYYGERSWTLNINKINDYTRTVWFSNLCESYDSEETSFYGFLSEDGRTITMPYGQETAWLYTNGFPITLYGYDGENIITSGALEISIYGDTRYMTLDFDEGLVFYIHGENGGYVDVLLPGIFAVKN